MGEFKAGVSSKASEAVAWMRGLPGMLSGALGDLGGLLVDKGRDIVSGLWRGIQSMGGWLRSSLVSWAKSAIPGPIADALGIHSPSRVLAREVGRWIPAGVVKGIEAGRGLLDRTMRTLVTPPTVPDFAYAGAGGYAGAGPYGLGGAVVDTGSSRGPLV
ncbi:hypothetical protein G3I78_47685, partial [Streptomyces sp. SID13726]|nr:hypothetical protein [Streptomyces sp. SID13726]